MVLVERRALDLLVGSAVGWVGLDCCTFAQADSGNAVPRPTCFGIDFAPD
jgi:hypothetical protein